MSCIPYWEISVTTSKDLKIKNVTTNSPFSCPQFNFNNSKMSTANKILSASPSDLELQVAQAFIDLESTSADFKADLRPLQLKSVREVRTNYIG